MKNLVGEKKEKAVLVLDIGTSFVKLGLFDINANPIKDFQVKFEHWMTIKSDGTYIFNPKESAELIERGIDELLLRSSNFEIIAFSSDTMASTILGLDNNNEPLTEVYTYGDTRSYKELSDLKAAINQKKIYDETGCPMHTSYIPARILWLRRTNAEIFKNVRLWTDFSNYLLRRWMNNKNIPLSYSVASWTGIFDRKKLNWNESILKSIELEKNSLPELKSYDFNLVGLNSKYSKRWKNLVDTPFFLPVGDGVSSNLGVGCNSEKKIALSIGTTGALRVVTRKTDLKIPQGLWAYKIDPENSLLGGAFSEGGNVGLWLKKLMNMQINFEEIETDDLNRELEQLLLRSKPDSHGLTVLPFLAGERAVGWAENATGTLSGIRLSTTQTDIYQAFLESIAYRFGLVSRRLMTVLGEECTVIASGGAIKASKYWLQMISNVLGMKVSVSNVEQDTGKGTAILALVGLGVKKSLNDFEFEISDTYNPDEKSMIIYQNAMDRQEELYSKIFS
ncbi:MAG: hypothetical protein CL769_05970 [Chloroflexi bacterium]|nr:hypothetical protein [Chloroflexota bacterium]